MKKSLFILTFTFLATKAHALVGSEVLENKLLENNLEVLSLQKKVESKEADVRASRSVFYPTLNAIGGWGQDKTDDLYKNEKGYLGYFEGSVNLFKGFKDQSFIDQKNIDLNLTNLDFESKKRELRLQLTETLSNMIYLHKLQNILDEEYKLTLSQKQMAAKKVSAGLTGSVDNLEFDLRETEIQIEQKQIDQQHEEAHQNFVKLFGEDVTDKEIERIDFSPVQILTKNPEQIKAESVLDFRKAELIHENAELEKKQIRADYLPSLDFSYSVGRITPSEDRPLKLNESKYALLLTIPLFSGFDTYYKTKAAAAAIVATERLKIQKQNDFRSEFNILKIKISTLKELSEINEQKLLSSQKYFQLTLAEYKRGIKNSPDLVNASERWFSSKKKKYELLKELEILNIKIQSFAL